MTYTDRMYGRRPLLEEMPDYSYANSLPMPSPQPSYKRGEKRRRNDNDYSLTSYSFPPSNPMSVPRCFSNVVDESWKEWGVGSQGPSESRHEYPRGYPSYYPPPRPPSPSYLSRVDFSADRALDSPKPPHKARFFAEDREVDPDESESNQINGESLRREESPSMQEEVRECWDSAASLHSSDRFRELETKNDNFHYTAVELRRADTVTLQTMAHVEDIFERVREEEQTGETGVQMPNRLGMKKYETMDFKRPDSYNELNLPHRHIAVMDGAFIGFKPDWYAGARDILMDVLSNKTKYKALLSLEEDNLQLVLDLMQMVIDHPNSLHTKFGNIFLKAMLRVSKKCTGCPRSYILSGIRRDEYPVASGHFGEVFQGDYNGEKVSLKVFKLYSSEMSKLNLLIKAFYKEAILWRHLSHPNLLPFYGIYRLSDSSKRICLVSPWMTNGNITQYLQRKPEVNRLHLTMDIARGISYLHEKSIVHGDLKGVNVLISDSGKACLADFGLSTVINSTPSALVWTSVETTKSNAGTVRWQAPELIGGGDDDDDSLPGRTKESDIYAFACVCYEVYVGRIPFYQHPFDATVIRKVMSGQRPPRPKSDSDAYIKWGLTDWMWSLIEGCWRGEPASRPKASDVVAKLSSRNEFLREEDHDNDSKGVLRPEVCRPLARHHPSLLEVNIQSCLLSLLSTL